MPLVVIPSSIVGEGQMNVGSFAKGVMGCIGSANLHMERVVKVVTADDHGAANEGARRVEDLNTKQVGNKKNNTMEIIRTFHPVGQGAFYSERFYKDEERAAGYNIVFDCGTSWGYIGKMKKVVSQAFNQNDEIDYLFISHLDYDHVSLVDTLLTTVHLVRNIVLPLISEEELLIVQSYHRISNHGSVVAFLQKIIRHIRGIHDDDYANGDYSIIFVGSEVNPNIIGANGRIWINGTAQAGRWTPDWVFIPYNVGYRSRKQELIMQFDSLLAKPDFNQEMIRIGEAPVQNGGELYERLKTQAFVRTVLENDAMKKAIKKAYENLPGGTNENSLLLYSGPANIENDYEVMYGIPYHVWYWRNIYEAGCLYTGDSNCDLENWRDKKYANVWDNIGTIQLPHHGSLDSFDVTANPLDRPYVFPVSCGSVNSYGHPSGKVLAYLLMNGCLPHIVTEMAGTLLMERIRG